MSDTLFDSVRVVMTGGMLLCSIMIIVWLFRSRKQGRRAFVMAGAFLVLGSLFWAFLNEKPTGILATLGVLLFILLAVDVAMRSVQRVAQEKEDKPS